jgi:hypothetical protein
MSNFCGGQLRSGSFSSMASAAFPVYLGSLLLCGFQHCEKALGGNLAALLQTSSVANPVERHLLIIV